MGTLTKLLAELGVSEDGFMETLKTGPCICLSTHLLNSTLEKSDQSTRHLVEELLELEREIALHDFAEVDS